MLRIITPILLATLITTAHAKSNVPLGPFETKVSVCFTPAMTCVDSIVTAINDSKNTIRVQAYNFTSPGILKALTDAQKRGVDVQVILDKTNDAKRYSGETFMTNAGVPTWVDYKPVIAHNKTIIIDNVLTIGGSYNYSMSAETKNAENVTFITSEDYAKVMTDNWNSRMLVSRKVEATN